MWIGDHGSDSSAFAFIVAENHLSQGRARFENDRCLRGRKDAAQLGQLVRRQLIRRSLKRVAEQIATRAGVDRSTEIAAPVVDACDCVLGMRTREIGRGNAACVDGLPRPFAECLPSEMSDRKLGTGSEERTQVIWRLDESADRVFGASVRDGQIERGSRGSN